MNLSTEVSGPSSRNSVKYLSLKPAVGIFPQKNGRIVQCTISVQNQINTHRQKKSPRRRIFSGARMSIFLYSHVSAGSTFTSRMNR